MKVLIITNQLLITCGVSKHLFYLLQEAKKHYEFEFTILCGGGDAIEMYRPLVKEILIWPWIKYENRSLVHFFKSIVKLLIKQKSERFDIIHSHNHYSANIAEIVSFLFRTRTIQSVHEFKLPIGILNHYPSKNIIVVNDHLLQYLKNIISTSSKRISLIRNGVPNDMTNGKKINQKLMIIAAGRFISDKGFDLYIRAISCLEKDIKDRAEFFLLGAGELESELKSLISELKVNIKYLINISDIRKELSNTNILVNPTRSNMEGFPMVIIEAAFAKNLILSSNFLGNNSILEDKVNCLIFKLNCIEELTDKIKYAIQNFEATMPLIENMYQLATKEFDLVKMFENISKLYKEITE